MYIYLPELQSWHIFAEEAEAKARWAGKEKGKKTVEVVSTILKLFFFDATLL